MPISNTRIDKVGIITIATNPILTIGKEVPLAVSNAYIPPKTIVGIGIVPIVKRNNVSSLHFIIMKEVTAYGLVNLVLVIYLVTKFSRL